MLASRKRRLKGVPRGDPRARLPAPQWHFCRPQPICKAMKGIWPAAARCSRLLRDLTARVAVAVAVLLICGLLAATLVRMAPGFGMDERMLDTRLSSGSLQAMERQGTQQRDILAYYWHYLRQLSPGRLGNPRSEE